MNKSLIIEIIKIILPSVSSIIVVYISHHLLTRRSTGDSYKNRLEDVYVPFFNSYIVFADTGLKLTDLDVLTFWTMMDILTPKKYLLGTKSQIIINNLFAIGLDYNDADYNNTSDLDKVKLTIESNFNQLVKELDKEYRNILRKLKLPMPPNIS